MQRIVLGTELKSVVLCLPFARIALNLLRDTLVLCGLELYWL